MKDYIIKKTDILYIKTIKYIDLDYSSYELLIDNNWYNKMRKVLFIDNHFIDLETGDEIYQINYEDGFIAKPIYRNTIYMVEAYRYDVSDEDLLRANYIYNDYLKKQELIKQKKLVLFRQERIY